MYANLRVEVGEVGPDAVETIYAWKVEIGPDGVTVHVDATDGDGSYAEPAGERTFQIDPVHGPRAITIGPDF